MAAFSARRAHALDLADSLRAPRTVHRDAERVGLDPLLRSQLSTMNESIDGLLRRGETGSRPATAPYEGVDDRVKLSSPVRSSPTKLRDHPPPSAGAVGPVGDGLLQRLLQGLSTDEVSVGDAIGTLESELHSPGAFASPSRAGRVGAQDVLGDTTRAPGLVLECERCSVMGLQVRALSQSLAGLGARAFNWSAGLNVAQRRDLSELILEYARPCAHIDESVEHLCKELSSTQWNDVENLEAKMQVARQGRASATWHWWDADPEGYPKQNQLLARKKPAQSPQAPPDHSLIGAGASPIPSAPSGTAPSITLTPPSAPAGAGVDLDGDAEAVTVRVFAADGSAGVARLHLYMYDEDLHENHGAEEGALVAEADVELTKGQAKEVVLLPDLSVKQLGRAFHEMEQPGMYIGIDEDFGTLTYADEPPHDILLPGGFCELVLMQDPEKAPAPKAAPQGGLWSKKPKS